MFVKYVRCKEHGLQRGVRVGRGYWRCRICNSLNSKIWYSQNRNKRTLYERAAWSSIRANPTKHAIRLERRRGWWRENGQWDNARRRNKRKLALDGGQAVE